MKTFLLTISIFFLFTTADVFALDGSVLEKLRELNWETAPGSHIINSIDASIATSKEEWLLQGKDARKYMLLTEGYDGFKPNALILRVHGPLQDTQVIYTYHEIGYVKTDDWEKYIDEGSLLKELSQNTAEANKVRAKGYPSLYVDGWVQKPYLDRQRATVYWAISAHTSNGNSIVNAKALKLGRKGFTEIVWMGSADQFTSAERSLSQVIAEYKYNNGKTYTDYVPGSDTVAAVGVGALAYKIITGKAAVKTGAGLLALFLIFAKKLWFLIVLPFIFAWKWIKRKFSDRATP